MDFRYLIANYFTHRDYLVDPAQLPGTLFTPLHLLFEAALLTGIFLGVRYVTRRRQLVRPVLTGLWILMVIWEAVIIWWESTAGSTVGLDLKAGLSLYPCSLYLYTTPILLWGRGVPRKMAVGYLCTLGMLGAAVNFIIPIPRLTQYSVISFPGMHTMLYHGTMLFTYLVIRRTEPDCYRARHWQELLYPCVYSLMLSVPANLMNYSPIGSDYMYFRGEFFLLAKLGLPALTMTGILYVLYIVIPALFYLPSYLHTKFQEKQTQELPALAEAFCPEWV